MAASRAGSSARQMACWLVLKVASSPAPFRTSKTTGSGFTSTCPSAGFGARADSPRGIAGMITMKMISKTSSTSIIGVMLISDARPPLPASLIDIAQVPFLPVPGNRLAASGLLPGQDLRCHDADVIHVRRVSDINYIRNARAVHIIVASDEHDTLRAVGVDVSQPGLQIALLYRRLVDFQNQRLTRLALTLH